MNKLPISIVIPTMNRAKNLKQTLIGIINQLDIPSQIIIVDQSQKEDIRLENVAIVKKICLKTKVNYIYQEEPSLTKARNIGLKNCENDIIVCMDDDVDVYDNIFKNINDILNDKDIAMIAGLDKNSINLNKDSFLGYFFGLKSFKYKNIGHVTKSMRGRFPKKISNRVQTMWAMGFFFVVRKSLIEKWQLSWNELFKSYAYAEDLDFSYGYYLKATEFGMKCIIDPKIIVKHNATQEYRIPSTKGVYMDMFHRMYLHYKYDPGILGFLCVQWSNFGLLIESILHKKNPKAYFNAIKSSILLRKDIEKGELHYEKYK
ncbi:MAG: glycosyltransferase family 2 protein [Clostridium sp.]